MTSPPDDPLLDVAQVAAMTDLSTKWVRKLAQAGELPVAAMAADRRLFRRSDVEAFIEARRVTAEFDKRVRVPDPPEGVEAP